MTKAAWTVVFAAAAECDLALIEAFLSKAYQYFGDPADQAAHHAAARVDAMRGSTKTSCQACGISPLVRRSTGFRSAQKRPRFAFSPYFMADKISNVTCS